MEKSELYRFSSLVPKVKKSIKKYKKTYNVDFLSQVWKPSDFQISPQKFLQPIKTYRFFGDFVTIDCPNKTEDFDDSIYQLDLHMLYKTIAKIDVSSYLAIYLEDKFSSDYITIDLFISRLDSLANQEAHNVAQILSSLKQYYQIHDEHMSAKINSELLKSDECNLEKILTASELKNYKEMSNQCENLMKKAENTFTWQMTKSHYKFEPYDRYGPILNKLVFNKSTVNLFMNKDFEKISWEDAMNLLQISSVNKRDYFDFLQGLLYYMEKDDCEIVGGVKTYENFKIPCNEIIKKVKFLSEKYEETNFFMTFCIEQKDLKKLEEFRSQKKLEEQNKCSVEKAKLKTKFKKIKNINSDSWKTLCLLYYGNPMMDEEGDSLEIEIPIDKTKSFWDNVDQTRVCKYRLI